MDAHKTPYGQMVDGKILTPLGGEWRDANDWQRVRQSIDRHKGFEVNNARNPVPLFKNRWGRDTWLEGMFEGGSVFMLCGGPSLETKYDLTRLTQPGIVTFGINNSPATVRPQLWIEVDSPGNFLQSIWLDPRIMKFVPICHTTKHIFDNVAWRESKLTVGECQNVHYYRRNERFDHTQFLWEDTVNWGCEGKHTGTAGIKGCRSVMLAAIRLAFALGFKTCFLLGADFRMAHGEKNYSWDQDRSKQSVKNNMNTYAGLDKRFALLRPLMEKAGFYVYNCNDESGLKAFDYMPFAKAVAHAQQGLPAPVWVEDARLWRCDEKTAGLYDREAKAKAEKKAAKKAKGKGKAKPAEETPPPKQGGCLSLADLQKAVGK